SFFQHSFIESIDVVIGNVNVNPAPISSRDIEVHALVNGPDGIVGPGYPGPGSVRVDVGDKAATPGGHSVSSPVHVDLTIVGQDARMEPSVSSLEVRCVHPHPHIILSVD